MENLINQNAELAILKEQVESFKKKNESLANEVSDSQLKLTSAESRAETAEAKEKKLSKSLMEAKADVEPLRKIIAEAENREDQIHTTAADDEEAQELGRANNLLYSSNSSPLVRSSSPNSTHAHEPAGDSAGWFSVF